MNAPTKPRDMISAATASAERSDSSSRDFPTTCAQSAERPVTAWTTYEELTPRQRALYGEYVRACDTVALRADYERQQRARSEAALKVTGGDTQAALALRIAEGL